MRRIPQNRIQPKISTMPRQRTEAAAFLDIYKLVIERKRLQQELENMEQRRQQITSRLAALDVQVAELEQTAHEMRSQVDSASTALKITPKKPKESLLQPEDFETFFLEY